MPGDEFWAESRHGVNSRFRPRLSGRVSGKGREAFRICGEMREYRELVLLFTRRK